MTLRSFYPARVGIRIAQLRRFIGRVIPILCLLLCTTTTEYIKPRLITTGCGKYRGAIVDFHGRNLDPVESFIGIKFAALRGSRFMPPTAPLVNCERTFKNMPRPPACPQPIQSKNELDPLYPASFVNTAMRLMPYIVQQTEDCLFLNLYVPAKIITTPGIVVDRLTDNIVPTKYGRYRGYVVNISDGYSALEPVHVYLGIIYASTLNGNLRFMPPTHPDGISEEILAHKHSPACPQALPSEESLRNVLSEAQVARLMSIRPFLQNQDVDCLSLNVYIPSGGLSRRKKIPVLIFVHGDSYLSGTGNAYDGSVLSSYGKIIVITLNYRLGVLGFLSTGDSKAPGNFALLDIMAALHWVRENVAAFGGDPNEITVMGHGTGASLVHILLISPVSAGGNLFKRVVLLSGSALSPWAVTRDPVSCTKRLAKTLNCLPPKYNSSYIVSCLHNKSIKALIDAYPVPPKYRTCLGPVVSPWSGVLPKPVDQLHRSRLSAFRKTDMMLGVTKYEAHKYLSEKDLKNDITVDKRDQIIRTFVHNNFRHHRQHIYDILHHHYTDWGNTENRRSNRDSILELLSDGLYVSPVVDLSNVHSHYARTFLYAFTYSSHTDVLPRWSGSVRGDELAFIFGAPLVKRVTPFPSGYSRSERNISTTVMTYLTNFVKSGNPNSTPDRSSTSVNWTEYEEKLQSYLHFGKRPKLSYHYRGKKIAIWLTLLPKINRRGAKYHSLDDFLIGSYNLTSFDEPSRLVDLQRLRALNPPTTEMPARSRDSGDKGLNSGSLVNSHTVTFSDVAQPTTNGDDYEHDHNDDDDASRAVHGAIVNSNKITLSITIAVGCTLLLLNFIAFIGIYYQKRNVRQLYKSKSNHMILKSTTVPNMDTETETNIDLGNSKTRSAYRETREGTIANSVNHSLVSLTNQSKSLTRDQSNDCRHIRRDEPDRQSPSLYYSSVKRSCPHDPNKLCEWHKQKRNERCVNKHCVTHNTSVVTHLSSTYGYTCSPSKCTDSHIPYVSSPSISQGVSTPPKKEKTSDSAESSTSGTLPYYNTIDKSAPGRKDLDSSHSTFPRYTDTIPVYSTAEPTHDNAPSEIYRTFRPGENGRQTDQR